MSERNPFAQHLQPGCIVEFMHGDRPQLAWVLDEQAGRLRLLTVNRREVKLPEGRLLAWSGPVHRRESSREEIHEQLLRHQQLREELAASLDPMEIWELAQGEVEQAPLQWFAELIWSRAEAADPDRLAALGRALLECKSHFKYQPPQFMIYTAEKVQQRMQEQLAAEERERYGVQGREFLERLWLTRNQPQGADLLPLPGDLEQQLKELLLARIATPDDQETEPVWKLLRKGLPETSHLELQLAQAWGIVPTHHNYHYDQAGYAPGDAWSAAHAAEVEALRARVLALREEPSPLPYVSIDAATTRDVDDAFHLEPDPAGLRLRLALARPTLGWEPDSPLGRAVAQRATSIYLPEGDSHMLPEALGTRFYSLLAGQECPALEVEMLLDSEGALLGTELRATWVLVRENSSYEAAEAAIATAQADPAVAGERERMLLMGAELAERLRQRRVAGGAVVIERAEPELRLEGEGEQIRVLIETKTETPRAQLLVSELMILVNTAVAAWARERNVPLLYRTQDIALAKESAGVWCAPEDIHRVVRGLSGACLELDPRPHASLGVPAYSSVSSPLRRYSDFVNMFQLQHFLAQGEPRFTREELAQQLPLLNARLEAAGRIQRFRPRYWKLLYCRQQGKNARFRAVVVDEGPHFLQLALPDEQLLLRGHRSLFGEKVYPGQCFRVRLGKIDPLHNEVHVLEAEEDEGGEPSVAMTS